MADVEIKYNNTTIASLNDSGSEVLETNGKLCEDDITVSYTRYSPEVYDGDHHQPAAPSLVTVTVVVLNSEYTACDIYNYNNGIGQLLGSIVASEQSVVVQPETDEIYIQFTGVVMTQPCGISYIGGEATLVSRILSGNTAGFRFSINGDVTIIMSGVK